MKFRKGLNDSRIVNKGYTLFASVISNYATLSAEDVPAVQRWFAAYTLPRHEKRVAQHFQARQIDHFLPLYTMQRRWKDGSRQAVQYPLFPNYLFVRITREKRISVLEVPGVLSIVGGGNESASVADSYVRCLQASLGQDKMEPHSYLVTGEWVRVKSGTMAGLEGVLVRRKNGFRVVITLELIKKSVAVELDIADLEPCHFILPQYQRNAPTI